jgi:hypothetical protein
MYFTPKHSQLTMTGAKSVTFEGVFTGSKGGNALFLTTNSEV